MDKEEKAAYESIIEEQKETLELLESTINHSKIGIYITDSKGLVLKVNKAHQKITGIAPEDVLGKKSDGIANGAGTKSSTNYVLKNQAAVQMEQFLENGHSYFVYAEPYFGENRAIKYVITNLIDTTEINRIRRELKKIEQDKERLADKVKYLETHNSLQKKLVYTSPIMQNVINTCQRIAPFDSTVLITGESGVGKEMFADCIYHYSQRVGKPFIKINCSSIPEPLLESELFGYEAGAFTSASSRGKKGLLEAANHGTIFLDEIADLPLSLQSKILRFLQEREIMHVGGITPIKVDVRVIAATNKDLEKMVAKNEFRQDLYYRLSVIPITIPPLARRREDIPFLIQTFITELNEKFNINKSMAQDVIAYLTNRHYKGNVRELKNLTERLILLAEEEIVTLHDLGEILNENIQVPPQSFEEIMGAYEKEVLQKYLKQYKTTSKMSEVLKISQPTVSRKLHKYGLKP